MTQHRLIVTFRSDLSPDTIEKFMVRSVARLGTVDRLKLDGIARGPKSNLKEDIYGVVDASNGITQNEIADMLKISQPSVSKHLKTLISEGRVIPVRDTSPRQYIGDEEED